MDLEFKWGGVETNNVVRSAKIEETVEYFVTLATADVSGIVRRSPEALKYLLVPAYRSQIIEIIAATRQAEATLEAIETFLSLVASGVSTATAMKTVRSGHKKPKSTSIRLAIK
jgi:hypothetical protein